MSPPIAFNALDLDVTTRCNLRCAYCYKGAERGTENDGADMPWLTARRAVRWFVRQAREQRIVLQFMGAEPLLAVDLIEAVCREGRRVAEAKGIDIAFGGATNGTLIDERVVALVKKYNLALNLSLDGTPEAHDACRRFVAPEGAIERGSPSSRFAFEGASRYLAARQGECRMTVRPETAAMMSAGVAHLRTLVSTIHVEPDVAADWTPESLDALAANYRQAADHYVLAVSQGAPFHLGPLEKGIRLIRGGRRPAEQCGAGRGLIAVDVKGELYPCHRLTGNVGFVAGNVWDGPDLAALDRFRKFEARYDARPVDGDCAGCQAVFICRAGCPAANIDAEGDQARVPQSYCHIQRIVAREAYRALYLLTHDDEARPKFEAHLRGDGQRQAAPGKQPCC